MDPQKLSPSARTAFKLIEFDKDEQLISEIRKHPIGLLFIYIGGTIITGMLLVLTVGGAALMGNTETGTGGDFSSIAPIIVVLGFILTVLSLIVTAIEAYLYRSNVVLVTSEKISQLLHQSLFNRKVSQLSIGDVQDVTIQQQGIIPHMFNYGTLVIETAGEQQNYSFTFVPDPYKAAKDIVGAHERNLKTYGN